MRVKYKKTFYKESDCNTCMNNCQTGILVTGDPAEDLNPLIYLSQMPRLLSEVWGDGLWLKNKLLMYYALYLSWAGTTRRILSDRIACDFFSMSFTSMNKELWDFKLEILFIKRGSYCTFRSLFWNCVSIAERMLNQQKKGSNFLLFFYAVPNW